MSAAGPPIHVDSRLRTLALLVLAAAVATLLVSLGTFTGFLSRGAINTQSSFLLESIPPDASDRGPIPLVFSDKKALDPTQPLPFRVRADARAALREKRTVQLSGVPSDELRPTRVETNTPNGNTVISGNANRNGSFSLVFDPNGNLAWGTIYDPDKERPHTVLARNDHGTIFMASNTVLNFDASMEDLRIPPGAPGDFTPPENGFSTQTIPPATVNVLAFYTPNAAAYLGGEVAAQAYIQAEQAGANIAYANSGIPHTVQLVGLINSSVLGFNGEGDHLSFITNNSQAAVLRDQYEADLIVLYSTNASYCGIGWIVAPWQSNASAYGFSDVIVEVQCQGLNVSAHEMGHNEGAHHDRVNASGSGAFPYSYGYQQKEIFPYWRTIMAYGCGSVNCPRIDHFSNPNVLYNGLPTGVPDDQPDSADVALTLTQTMSYVSNYRGPSAGGNAPPTPTNVLASDALYPTKVHLTWSPSSEAIQYKVYRSDSPSMSNPIQVALAFAGFADDLSFDDTPLAPGTTYYYSVKAQNAYGTSGYSAADAGSISLGTGANEVKGLHASQGSSPTTISLSWQNSTVSKNKLYRAANDIPCPANGVIQTFTDLAPQSNVYYTNTASGGVVPETRYYYSVGAIDGSGNETCTSLTQSGFAGTLSTPVNLQASDGTFNDHVRLTWTGSPIADYYTVFSGVDPSPAAMHLKRQFIHGTSFDDYDVMTGGTEYYRVTASNAFAATPFSNADAGSTSFGAPTSVQATDNAFPDRIVVTWNTPNGPSEFKIYRNTVNDFSSAQNIGSVFEITTFTDNTAGVNTTYFYWVVALNPAGGSSLPSAPDTGSLTGYGSNCVAGDLDLGGGNCRAHLSVTANSADGWLDVQASTWTEAVQAPAALTVNNTQTNASIYAYAFSNQSDSSRYFATFPSAGYGTKTLTSAALVLYEIATPTYPTTQANHLYVVPAAPGSPMTLEPSDYSHVPLPPSAPTLFADKPYASIPSYGSFSLVFTPEGMNAFRNSAANGFFSIAVLNSAAYENYAPGPSSSSLLIFLTQEYDAIPGYAPEMVVNYHG